MTIEISAARALELLKAEVDAEGADFVYKADERADPLKSPKCVYVENGCPSCLVGRALHRAGVPLEILAKLDDVQYDKGVGISDAEFDDDSVVLEDDARGILATAQTMQDAGATWGEALEAASHALDDEFEDDE